MMNMKVPRQSRSHPRDPSAIPTIQATAPPQRTRDPNRGDRKPSGSAALYSTFTVFTGSPLENCLGELSPLYKHWSKVHRFNL
ncbi:hypothetical protein PO909_028124 [Leuciscus waleckii]